MFLERTLNMPSKKNMLFILILLLLVSACDNKEKVKYIAQSAYDELKSKYEKSVQENDRLKSKNIQLHNENELLTHDLKKYKNGFKSMYE